MLKKNFKKKVELSSLGAYKVARVIIFPSDSMPLMINLPSTSEYNRRIWKEKLLWLKSMGTPSFELEQQLKSVLYPHSADQIAVFSLAQCTSCNKYLQNLFAFSHLNISLLFCLFPMPHTLNERICNSISLTKVSLILGSPKIFQKHRDIKNKKTNEGRH